LRDRIRTPFFFLPCGPLSTQTGEESPGRQQIGGRALVGRLVADGRFLIRQKTGHSTHSVCYAAHDLFGGIDVGLELHPDGTASTGYRLGLIDAPASAADLPNLLARDLSSDWSDQTPPAGQLQGSRLSRLWRALCAFFSGNG
jgi:hypothetical protein